MVTFCLISLSVNLLISLFGDRNIDYKPVFYFYGVLLTSTRHCVHHITLLASVGYQHTSKYFLFTLTQSNIYDDLCCSLQKKIY